MKQQSYKFVSVKEKNDFIIAYNPCLSIIKVKMEEQWEEGFILKDAEHLLS